MSDFFSGHEIIDAAKEASGMPYPYNARYLAPKIDTMLGNLTLVLLDLANTDNLPEGFLPIVLARVQSSFRSHLDQRGAFALTNAADQLLETTIPAAVTSEKLSVRAVAVIIDGRAEVRTSRKSLASTYEVAAKLIADNDRFTAPELAEVAGLRASNVSTDLTLMTQAGILGRTRDRSATSGKRFLYSAIPNMD